MAMDVPLADPGHLRAQDATRKDGCAGKMAASQRNMDVNPILVNDAA
jgi:hypothetical protein